MIRDTTSRTALRHTNRHAEVRSRRRKVRQAMRAIPHLWNWRRAR